MTPPYHQTLWKGGPNTAITKHNKQNCKTSVLWLKESAIVRWNQNVLAMTNAYKENHPYLLTNIAVGKLCFGDVLLPVIQWHN